MATSIRSPSAVGDLRQFADAVVEQLPIFALPRTEALLHVLRTVQSLDLTNQFGAVVRGRIQGGYAGMRYSQDLLRWLIFKLFSWCPAGGSKVLTSTDNFKTASEAIGKFIAYSHLQDGIVSTEAGFSDCEINSAKQTIRFAPNSGVETQQTERLLREELQRTADAFADLLDGSSLPREATEFLLPTARLDGEKMTLSYRTTGRILNAFTETLRLPQHLLPLSSSVGPYTLGDFWTVWKYLATQCAVLHFMLLVVCKELQGQWTAHNSAALILSRDRLVSQLRHHHSLRSPVALEVINDLTYDIAVPWTDVMYQPLLPLTAREVVTIPTLILGSNPERNLLAIIDSLRPGHDLKDAREGLMLQELAPLFDRRRFGVVERLLLGPRTQRVGDVDLFVCDRSGEAALAISLKWFYGPDSSHEVRMHDDWFREGLAKHKRCLHYLRENAAMIAETRPELAQLNPETRVMGIVVSRVSLPSELVGDDEIPIVTMARLVGKLEHGSFSLTEVYRELARKVSLPDTVEHRQRTKEFEFGGWTISVPQTEWRVRVPSTP